MRELMPNELDKHNLQRQDKYFVTEDLQTYGERTHGDKTFTCLTGKDFTFRSTPKELTLYIWDNYSNGQDGDVGYRAVNFTWEELDEAGLNVSDAQIYLELVFLEYLKGQLIINFNTKPHFMTKHHLVQTAVRYAQAGRIIISED